MNLKTRLLRLPRIIASIALILCSAFLTTASQTPGEKTLNLSEFNPVADGVTDNGPAFQKALDALAAAGGGTLLIPAGSYRIATPVVKDFSALSGAKIRIQGVPSTTMPAPVTALGHELAAGLDLTSEIIPDTGEHQSAFTLSNLHELTLEHVGFTGIETIPTNAFITLYLIDIDNATIRHCEFYGLSSFGWLPDLGGGNLIRAVRSELSIELSVFLGCTGNSGTYSAVVENAAWRKFSISNSIFLDYGLRPFYSKTGLGAPLSWINIGNAAPTTPDSQRREVVVRDVFLDEGGWVGLSALPYRYSSSDTPIDLIYISGLKMNVANMGTTGHLLYDARNLLIENSHYGWSHNAYSALDINGFDNVILDKLTCIANANRIVADDRTGRLTVINSVYTTLASLAQTTIVLETEPEQDPVQYVRQQFVTVLGKQPDPAAHFYWSDVLIKCGSDNHCLNQERSELNKYLNKQPQETFTLAGTVTDENGAPVSGVKISLTGSQLSGVVTDAQGGFQFGGLPTSGKYTVGVDKRHYTFTATTQNIVHPATNVNVAFNGRLNRHAISGRVVRPDSQGISGVKVRLAESPTTTAMTDANGSYSFPELPAGENYTVVPELNDFVFDPVKTTFEDLSEDRVTNFMGNRTTFSLAGSVIDESGKPLSGVSISLTGSQSSGALTDLQGRFQFAGLSARGSYTVAVDKKHYSFTMNSQTISRPMADVTLDFHARLNRHSIAGRIKSAGGMGVSGIVVQLAQSPATTATTDANGFYSFNGLAAGGHYTVVPLSNDLVFAPLNATFEDLAGDRAADFVGRLQPELLIVEGNELALALDSVSFTMQPFSIFRSLAFSTDGFIRIIVFAKNLESVSSPSQVSVGAKDSEGRNHPLEIEYIGEVVGQSWLKQLNLKIPSNSLGGKCVQLRLAVADVTSNEGRICIDSAPK